MSIGIYRRILSGFKNNRNRSLGFLAAFLLGMTGLILTAAGQIQKQRGWDGVIERNTYGKGSKTETFDVKVGDADNRKEIQVEIGERQYTDAQIKKLFRQAIAQMDEWILGDNKSPDRIESDLNLLKQIPGQPIDVEWELDRYDVLDGTGELNKKELAAAGTAVQLAAILTYRLAPEKQARYECAVMVYPPRLSAAEQLKKQITKQIKKKEQTTKQQPALKLPQKIAGQKITYYQHGGSQGLVLLGMAVLIGGLLIALEKQNTRKQEQEVKNQMLRDYPEIVSKLTLLLGAGMTVKKAWRKMTADYEARRGHAGTRQIYEEMRITYREMQSGITEAQSYERFGRRCNTQAYIKLGALLSQNLRKGTKGLNDLLRLEALQAFEERKAAARRLGEEAGTKLLLPMFLMLSIVLIIVVVPAFLSIQM